MRDLTFLAIGQSKATQKASIDWGAFAVWLHRRGNGVLREIRALDRWAQSTSGSFT
jgi:hypothetical protein